jgi:hypothetical protein
MNTVRSVIYWRIDVQKSYLIWRWLSIFVAQWVFEFPDQFQRKRCSALYAPWPNPELDLQVIDCQLKIFSFRVGVSATFVLIYISDIDRQGIYTSVTAGRPVCF